MLYLIVAYLFVLFFALGQLRSLWHATRQVEVCSELLVQKIDRNTLLLNKTKAIKSVLTSKSR